MADIDPAVKAQEDEMRALGLKPHSEKEKGGKKSDLEDDDSEDMGDLDEEETEDEEDEDEDTEEESEEDDDSEEDEEDSDEEDEEEDSEDKKSYKKGVPFKKFNELRSELRTANKKIAEMATKNAELEAKLPDDFEQRVDALAKEIGVEDPEGLKKITSLMKEVMKGQTAGLEKKLSDLEEKFSEVKKNEPVKDEFSSEWETFEEDLQKDFPNATPAQLKEAQKLMNTLSHTKGIGGKAYKDDDGRELLDPFPLDYILFKNKDKFDEILGGRKSKGLENNRSQGLKHSKDDDGEFKQLPKNASAAEIIAYEKRSSRAIADGTDNLRAPVDNTI